MEAILSEVAYRLGHEPLNWTIEKKMHRRSLGDPAGGQGSGEVYWKTVAWYGNLRQACKGLLQMLTMSAMQERRGYAAVIVQLQKSERAVEEMIASVVVDYLEVLPSADLFDVLQRLAPEACAAHVRELETL